MSTLSDVADRRDRDRRRRHGAWAFKQTIVHEEHAMALRILFVVLGMALGAANGCGGPQKPVPAVDESNPDVAAEALEADRPKGR